MICYVCSQNNFHKLDGWHSQSLMQICKSCGVLCHDVSPDRQKKMNDYYRKEYRKMPNSINLITATNKLQYWENFLRDFLKGKKGLICGDVGAATGYLLNWLKAQGHRVAGAEYTVTFRRMSEHFYGIPLTEELEAKHKYDLITLCHTLEHMIEPDKQLEKLKSYLSDQGVIMVSTPFWLGVLENQAGTPMTSSNRNVPQLAFDELFHKDHINLFSQAAMQNMFKKLGLAVIKDDMVCYGQTYLVKSGNKYDIHPEDWRAVLDIVTRQKMAIEHYVAGRYQDAITVFPDFPEAHIQLIFRIYGKDPDRQQDLLNNLPAGIRNHQRILSSQAQWLAQYERLDEALDCIDVIQRTRPQTNMQFMAAGILSRKGKYRESMVLYSRVAGIQPQMWQQCYDEIIWNACQMGTWDEVGMKQATEIIMQKAVESGQVSIQKPGLAEIPVKPANG